MLAHQIAAGEIVERPASVVKELVENSLDAEARRVLVSVEEGGTRRIQVTDDGRGMSREDASLAFEHHATSKISEIDDLNSIQTLGFRGEALPSIASVSRTLMKTTDRAESEDASTLGTEVEFVGGELKGIKEISWPQGTEITVENLFFNVPARRKFLKTISTELSHVSRLVMCYALAFPGVEFQLEHKGKSLVDAARANSLEERAFQIFGDSLLEKLIPLDYMRDEVTVTGFTSLPHEQRNSSQSLYLFVNRRMVRDRVLTHAIRMAYRDLIPSSAYPVSILFVDLDPEKIDVNVHPTKVEIRFRNSQTVHSAIFHAIEKALLLNQQNLSSISKEIDLSPRQDSSHSERVSQSIHRYFQKSPAGVRKFGWAPEKGRESGSTHQNSRLASFSETLSNSREPSSSQSSPHDDEIPETAHLSATPKILGQFVESFLVGVDREGVMLIDQHVAHERILYDRALRAMTGKDSIAVQRLLMPVTVKLHPQQQAVADEILRHLNENGFEVEWFGKDTLIIRGLPAMVKEADVEALIEEVLQEVEHLDELHQENLSEQGLLRIRQKIAISLSCRAAIKINTKLTEDKMQWLVDELFHCENPYTCPHGRPIILRLNIEEVLRGFKRI